MDDRYAALKPRDTIATVLSMPRRFKALAGAIDEANTPQPVILSTRTLVDHTAEAVAALTESLDSTATADEPDVVVEVPLPTDPRSLYAALSELSDACEAFGERAEGISAEAWNRSATVEGGDTVTAADIARHAARVSAENLRELEELLG